MVAIPMGALNALLNFVVWLFTGFCFCITEKVYQRLSSYILSTTGKTRATDASEVIPQAWLFGHMWTRRKRAPATWVIIMLTLNFALFPLEILLEAGAYERYRCTPTTLETSGICASKWNGHSKYGISAAAQSTLRLNWADKNWQFVSVGSLKSPEVAEVREWDNQLSRNRTYLAHDCRVFVGGCPISGCGSLTFKMTKAKLFGNCLRDWTHRPKMTHGHEDEPTYDKIGGIAYMFWKDGTEIDAERANGTFIHVGGVEALLSDLQMEQVNRVRHSRPWDLPLVPSQTRTYKITCKTDGLIDEDLAMGIGLFRTAQMEDPSMTRKNKKGLLTNVPELTPSDIIKAAYSVKAEDWSDSCKGLVDRYRRCGAFKNEYFIPFFIVSGVIIVIWIVVICTIRDVENKNVPVNVGEWRETALGNLTPTGDREEQMATKTSLANSELEFINSLSIRSPESRAHTRVGEDSGKHGRAQGQNHQDAILDKLENQTHRHNDDDAY